VPFVNVQAAALTEDWVAKTVDTAMGKLIDAA
jgi:hypothetical protein